MTATTPPIRLFMVDDHAMFRQGLARIFAQEPDFAVVGQCSSAAEALTQLPETDATMVLLDVDLGSERSHDFVPRARKLGFDGQILIVTAGVSGQEAVQLVQTGVAGILHKHHSERELCETIRGVAGGEVYLEKEYMSVLFRSVDRTQPQARATLTDRDKVVLRFIFQGFANKEISHQLGITESGVKSALRQLFDKLGVRTRAQVVKVALEKYRDQL